MPKKTKKPNVRVCSLCQKPGHNKARCPVAQINENAITKNTNAVRFFIHDAPKKQTHSPHIVNLQARDLWKDVKSIEPEKNHHLYQTYHELPKVMAMPNLSEHTTDSTPKINFFTEQKDKLSLTLFPPEVEVFPEMKNAAKDLGSIQTKKSFWQNRINRKTAENKTQKPAKTPKQKKEFNWPKPEFHFSFRRALAGATLVAIFLVLPLKAGSYYQDIKSTTSAVAENGTKGFMALQDSTSALLSADIGTAGDATEQALNSFNSAVQELSKKHQILQKIASVIPIVKGEVASRQNILTAGQKITLGNTYLLQGIKKSQELNSDTLTDKINILVNHLDAATPNYQEAVEDLEEVQTDVLPIEYQAGFEDFRELFKTVVNDLNTLTELGRALNKIFGENGTRRYLLVFQNPHEIRPTGGFAGSFAVLDIKDGKILKIDLPAGGSYDLKGQLDKWVEPPTPLLLANNRWEFQDANWFPDFSASAEKMAWFYRHSRNLSVDGVIAINATVLERLLSVIGPMEDSERQLTLTSENALAVIQDTVENGEEKNENKPKQILTDLAPKFLDCLQNIKPEYAMPILTNLSEALEKKEIQAYFTDTSVQKQIEKMNWGGRIKETRENQDYLMVVNANIQGQKSDAMIKQTIEHQAEISDNGEVMNTVVVTREHTGKKSDDLYNQTNIDFIRLYVPSGSQLISVSGAIWPHEKNFKVPAGWTESDEFLNNSEHEVGFEPESGTRIVNEFGKTSFGNWIITEPGQTSKIVFTYKLPFKIVTNETEQNNSLQNLFDSNYLTADYKLIAQKQSGVESEFYSQIIFPDNWHPTWKTGLNAVLAANGMSISTDLKKDTNWGLVMKKNLK